MNLSLEGKYPLICGSTQGIGLAIAEELALLGANCTLVARNENVLKTVVQHLDIALQVKDVQRSLAFYQKVFGVKEMYAYEHFIQVQTPGTNDIIVFETYKGEIPAIKPGFHFGFRLTKPSGIEKVVRVVEEAGGTIRDSGELAPGEPYVFFYDPDGYEIEVWFEKIPETHQAFN